MPGLYLVIDWTKLALGLHMFCAVLAWSRYRFIRFAADERRETTLGLLAECFEELGAVPAVVLTDRMGCLKNGVVANVVVPASRVCSLRRAAKNLHQSQGDSDHPFACLNNTVVFGGKAE